MAEDDLLYPKDVKLLQDALSSLYAILEPSFFFWRVRSVAQVSLEQSVFACLMEPSAIVARLLSFVSPLLLELFDYHSIALCAPCSYLAGWVKWLEELAQESSP